MKSSFSRLLLIACLIVAAGCSSPNESRDDGLLPPLRQLRVDGDRAFKMLEAQVAIGNRHSNTPEAKATAGYIAAMARDFGYLPVIDTWTETTASGPMTFHNVYAELPGPRPGFLLLGSHFDTKYMPGIDFQGANDAASSTALLLEIMHVLQEAGDWQGRTLRFAFFDGEEARNHYSDNDGLHGSKRLAARYQREGLAAQCRAMILLDMVGDKDLTITISKDNDSALIQHVFRIAEEQGVRQHFGFYLRGTILDDHVPFQQIGIPAINLIDFQYGPNNSYWHTERDTLENVSAESLRIVGNVVLQLIQEL